VWVCVCVYRGWLYVGRFVRGDAFKFKRNLKDKEETSIVPCQRRTDNGSGIRHISHPPLTRTERCRWRSKYYIIYIEREIYILNISGRAFHTRFSEFRISGGVKRCLQRNLNGVGSAAVFIEISLCPPPAASNSRMR